MHETRSARVVVAVGGAMRAVVRDRYGGPEVLRVEEVPRPEPGPGEVVVRVRASSVNRADRYVLEGRPLPLRLATGLWRPRRRGLGMDLAGEVAAVGPGVAALREGDAVFGQVDLGETWADLARAPATTLAPMPAGLSFAEAAAMPLAGLTAWQGLVTHGKLRRGQRVLVNGATGAVGPFAVQIAKALGAEVTAVCSARNVDLVRALGADHVLAYESEDPTAGDVRCDVFFDVAGTRPLRDCRRVTARDGVYLPVGAPSDGPLGPVGHLLAVMLQAPFGRPRVAMYTGTPNRADLEALGALLLGAGARPHVSRTFPLEAAADALRCVATEHPPTKVVLTAEG